MTKPTMQDLIALMAVRLNHPLIRVEKTVQVLKRARLLEHDRAGRGGVGRRQLTSRGAIRLLLALMGAAVPARAAMACQSIGALRPVQVTWQYPGEVPGTLEEGAAPPSELPPQFGWAKELLSFEDTLVAMLDIIVKRGNAAGYPSMTLLVYRSPERFAAQGTFRSEHGPINVALRYGELPGDGVLHVAATVNDSILFSIADLLRGAGERPRVNALAEIIPFPLPTHAAARAIQ